MPRRKISILLTVAALLTLTANATDFWLAKDWRRWSKDECHTLLNESPWAHGWVGRAQAGNAHMGSAPPSEAVLADQLVYAVQLRSSLPVREAIVRERQLDQKYENMTNAERAAFDAQAGPILNRDYGDSILVHVDFAKSKTRADLAGELNALVQKVPDALNAMLVGDDRSQTKAIRVTMNSKEPYTIDFLFPRAIAGTPAIREGQKKFSVQFQSPQLPDVNGLSVPNQVVVCNFDLSKMVVNGKVSY
jgi:hypothetical protein